MGLIKRLKKQQITTLLITIFIILTALTFLTVHYAHFGNSSPNGGSPNHGSQYAIAIAVGPGGNSSDVSLDTTVVVDTWRNPSVKDLFLTPEVSIMNVIHESDGFTGTTTYYFKDLLKPATTYNASVMVGNETIIWSFATTSEALSLQSQIGRLISVNAGEFSLVIATITTLVVGTVIWVLKRRI